MDTIRLSTAQALVKFLNQVYLEINGVEHKFVTGMATIFGHGNVLGLGEALAYDQTEWFFYPGKNEQGMGHVALGYTKMLNRTQIIACTTSVGPGSANLVTTAATATANNLPFLCLLGDTFSSRNPDPVLQQVEHSHDFNVTTNDAFKAVCKYWDRIQNPEALINSMLWAIEVLVNPELTGAVAICLPQDVQAQVYDFPNWFFNKRVYKVEKNPANPQTVQTVATALIQAQQPLIVCGGGVRYSQAGEALLAFSLAYNIPVAFTQAGKSSLKNLGILNLGGLGVTGTLKANEYAQTADLILGCGTKYSDFTTGSKQLFSDQAQFFNINVKKFDAQKMLGQGLVGDAEIIIKQLHAACKQLNLHAFSHITPMLNNAQLEWEQEKRHLSTLSAPEIATKPVVKDDNTKVVEAFSAAVKEFYQTPVEIFIQAKALLLMNEILKNQVIFAAAGSLPGDLQRLWETERIDAYNVEYGYSCMGHEIQAAIGGSLALKKKVTYAFIGDGSFLMLHQELHTAVQLGIPVVVILFDNSGFGCINNLQAGFKIKDFETHFYTRQTTDQTKQFLITDYAKIAAGYGVDAHLAKSEKQLKELLQKSLTTTKPMLIEIKTYPKTMTHNYGPCQWQVGVSEAAYDSSVSEKAKKTNVFFTKEKKFN